MGSVVCACCTQPSDPDFELTSTQPVCQDPLVLGKAVPSRIKEELPKRHAAVPGELQSTDRGGKQPASLTAYQKGRSAALQRHSRHPEDDEEENATLSMRQFTAKVLAAEGQGVAVA
eukprot:TRINITY_DN83011_c0_g1_i1.p2 TRINITY_DN83011_c0_g1~~TRINITY_DN83011_c0_g1_i1.p2  ORF type:complete len:132 (+),score=23.58 TRINITY_DN83011_c0_g1_i1:46-396(+)